MSTEALPRLSAAERLKVTFGPCALPSLFATASFYLLFLSAIGQAGWGIPGPLSSAFLAVLFFGVATVIARAGKPSIRRARIVAGLIDGAALFTVYLLIKLVLEAVVSGGIQPVHTAIAAVVTGAAAVVSHLAHRRHGHTAPSEGQQ